MSQVSSLRRLARPTLSRVEKAPRNWILKEQTVSSLMAGAVGLGDGLGIGLALGLGSGIGCFRLLPKAWTFEARTGSRASVSRATLQLGRGLFFVGFFFIWLA